MENGTDVCCDFGANCLRIVQGVGTLAVGRQAQGADLEHLQTALLAALGRAERLRLDCSAVECCDLLFFQLLLAARRDFQARNAALEPLHGLNPEFRRAAEAQGLGCVLGQA